MNKKKRIVTSILFSVIGFISFLNIESNYFKLNTFAKEVQSKDGKSQQEIGPLITYESQQIGDREKLKVTVRVEDRSGVGIKEFRDHTGKLINGNSYAFEIARRGNYTFTAIDNNNQESSVKIDDFWINPITSNVSGRVSRGSGYWSSLNLREWLNSDKEEVQYTCNPPSKEFMEGEAYDREAGFLSEFTEKEKESILVTRKRFFVYYEARFKEGGVNYPKHLSTIGKSFLGNLEMYALDNYKDINYRIENDKVFLLSPTELYQYVIQRGLSLDKDVTQEAKEKNNITNKNVNWWLQYSAAWREMDWLGVVNNKSTKSLVGIAYSDEKNGVVPAMHINGIHEINGRKIIEYKIGEIVEFGRYLGSPIEWQIINKTNDGHVLLLSKNIIDIKQADAKGDQPRLYSDYINFENIDIDLVDDLQFTSTEEIADIEIPSVEILNEYELSQRKNSAYTVDFEISDLGSGVKYVELPDESKIYSDSFSYRFNKNGDYVFRAVDNAGNYLDFLVPIYNINQEIDVNIGLSSTNWSNTDVIVDINTTNDVVNRLGDFKMDNIKNKGLYSGLPNYTSYNNAVFKISGKAKLLYLKENINTSIGFGGVFNTKILKSYGYVSELRYDTSSKLYLNDLSFSSYKDFELEYSVPRDYSYNLKMYLNSDLDDITNEIFKVDFKDVKIELISNKDESFYIERITLPDGSYVKDVSYSDTILEEGINTWTYKVLDSRGKETIKTITTKIDKTAPILNLTYDKDKLVNNRGVTVNVDASDSLSGVKRIRLPNGNYINSSNASYTVSGNGNYTFECEDLAGNITSKTISINGSNSNLNTEINKSDNWTNEGVQINIDLNK